MGNMSTKKRAWNKLSICSRGEFIRPGRINPPLDANWATFHWWFISCMFLKLVAGNTQWNPWTKQAGLSLPYAPLEDSGKMPESHSHQGIQKIVIYWTTHTRHWTPHTCHWKLHTHHWKAHTHHWNIQWRVWALKTWHAKAKYLAASLNSGVK